MKIIVKKEIKEGEGTCDFCGESKKGYKGNAVTKNGRFLGVKYEDISLENIVILDLNRHFKYSLFFGNDKYVVSNIEKRSAHIIKDSSKINTHDVPVTITPLICPDCIQEMYEQLDKRNI